MKSYLRFLSLGSLLLPLLSCGSSPHAPEEKYFLIATNIQLPYWQAARAGLMRAAAQLQVRADFAGPNTYDPKAQQQEFQRVVRLRPSGILISPADPALMKADIDAAIDAGIPVITIDSDSPESKRLAFVGTNNYQAGLMGGKLAATQLKGKGSVAVYGMPEQTNLNERLKGYQEAFSAHPQIKIVEVINVKGDPRIAFDSTGALLDKLKDKVDAFVCLEATAGKEVAEVLSRRQIKGRVLVAMDTDQGTLEWIQKGVIAATIGQKPFTMAFYGLKMLDDLLHHKLNPLGKRWAQDSFSPIPTFVDTGATLIDKGSVGEFLQSRDSATADKNP